ncbi:hypothetical protein N9S00_08855 [Luminiphilus sp.]|nr:hypothetical protein [Luminiphilus sp.]
MKTAFAQNTRRFSFTGTAYFGLLGVITWMIAVPLRAETAAAEPTTLPSEGAVTETSLSDPAESKSEAKSSDGVAPSDQMVESEGLAPSEGTSWMDAGHGLVTERADDLTQWFDAYFGGGDSEDDEAYSRLLIRGQP